MLRIAIALLLASPALAAQFEVTDTTILIDGELVRADADRFVGILAIHPDLKRVSINSPGGDLVAGLKMGEAIRERKLETYVEAGSREAASAAAYLFMGGVERVVKGDRGVGVHAFYSPAPEVRKLVKQKSGDELVHSINEFERRTQEATLDVVEYATRMLGDARIVREAVKTGSDAMLWPDSKTLVDLKVATKVVPLSPDEIPDLDWAYGEFVGVLAGWLDADRADALDEPERHFVEAILSDDSQLQAFRTQIDETMRSSRPGNRTVAMRTIVEPLGNAVVERVRAIVRERAAASAP